MIKKYELKLTDWKIIAALAAVIFFVWNIFIILSSSLEFPQEVRIKEGQGISAIAENLKEKGVINNELTFVLYTLATGNEKKLQAGRYIFQPGDTIPGVVYILAKGLSESEDITITIPEGFNVFDIDNRIASFGFAKEGEFIKKYYKNEGQFFPDTYQIKNQDAKIKEASNIKLKNEPDRVDEIVEKMFDNFEKKTEMLFKNLSMEQQKETIIIASIVEKETKTEEDMRLVAGIIKNRLMRGMSLQIDATVSYGACLKNLQYAIYNPQPFRYCDVSQIPVGAEIKIDGLYNTYTRIGLPAGPIANPGIMAIQAALSPVKSDYLYYLSTRDGSQIIFSKTASEHIANRRKYLGI